MNASEQLAIRADILDTLKEEGLLVTLRVPEGGDFDSTAGTNATEYYQEFTGYGIITEYTTEDMAAGLIQRGDQKLLVLFDDPIVIPTSRHRIVTPYVEYDIQSVGEVAPAGITLLYKLQVRR